MSELCRGRGTANADEGYFLPVTDNRNSTILSKMEGRHLVKCPKWDDQPVRLIRRDEELRAIACPRCRNRLVWVETNSIMKAPGAGGRPPGPFAGAPDAHRQRRP
ncbi:MAG: hypothetical protein JRN06_09760 [Nitrososphaerota archaeon]|nr:hypothetical protein [Nitrososphaerota archaeon]MDG7024871.1 hypothetical protein [Nitrososphaerota archaeon]